MTTATIGREAKNIVQKIEHLKETDTVCHACEVLKLTAYVVLPVIIPFTLYSFSTLYQSQLQWRHCLVSGFLYYRENDIDRILYQGTL